MATITVRVSEGMKAEIESLAKYGDVWWANQSEFIREALDTHITKYWQGERFCQRPQLKDESVDKGEK